jgi:WD40 repeat protein
MESKMLLLAIAAATASLVFPLPSRLAASAESAVNAPAPFVQRWGGDAAGGPFDYHAGTNRLLTSHGATAVLWDGATGLALEAMDIGGGPLAVAFSADGRRVLTASGNGRLRVWEVQTGKTVAEFDPPPAEVMAAAFSSDGRRVAAGCYDHTVWVGAVDDGAALRELPGGHRGHVISLRFSPDSRRLLSGSYDRQAILWDVQADRAEQVFPTPVETRSSAFRADGRRLLTVGSGTEQGRGRVIEWDIPTRRPVRVIRETVRAAWFVGDDVVVSVDNELRLYRHTEQETNKTTESMVLAPPLPAGSGDRLFVAPDGWQMWVPGHRAEPAGHDAPLDRPESPVLRSPAGETLTLSLPLRGADSVALVDISLDGTRLLTSFELSGRDPPRLVLWDLTVPEPVHSFPGTMGRFRPDGRRVLVGGARSLQLRRVADARPLRTYEIDRGEFESARFVAGGRQLLTASGDWYDGNQGQVLLWDVESGEVLRSFFRGDTAANHAVMDRDEKHLLATFTFGERGAIDKLGIFDASSAALLHVISPDDHALWWLRAHPSRIGSRRETITIPTCGT